MTIPHLIVKVFDHEWAVLNRIYLIETPLSVSSLASVGIPWKKWSVKLIFAAFRDKSDLWSFCVSSCQAWTRQKIGTVVPSVTAQGRPVKIGARYSLHNKMLYDPGCTQAILRELCDGMSLALSADRYCKYLLQGKTIGCPVSLLLSVSKHTLVIIMSTCLYPYLACGHSTNNQCQENPTFDIFLNRNFKNSHCVKIAWKQSKIPHS